MTASRVSVRRAAGYDLSSLTHVIEQSIQSVGRLDNIVQPSQKIFIKINHLSPASPAERGIVTHPIFLAAVLAVLKRTGADITVGDDIESIPADGFRISGIRQVCDAARVKLINLKEGGFVDVPLNGKVLSRVFISKVVLDADLIINLPKLKTHSLTVFTGGIKNLYGTIPQGYRQKFHFEHMRPEQFSKMLVDIYSVLKPRLTLMDGIMAMEGEGPANGRMRNLGVVICSTDTVAVDAVASKIIGIEPFNIRTTRNASDRGLGNGDLSDIEIVGETLKNVTASDFKLPVSYTQAVLSGVPAAVSRFFMNQITVKPTVVKHACQACKECEKICPASAIVVKDKLAVITEQTCIRCMCCHEVCRFNAIHPTRPIIGRVVLSIFERCK